MLRLPPVRRRVIDPGYMIQFLCEVLSVENCGYTEGGVVCKVAQCTLGLGNTGLDLYVGSQLCCRLDPPWNVALGGDI